MAFYNVDGVKSVQRSREQQQDNEDGSLGEIFADQVSSLLGRELDFDSIKNARNQSGANRPTYTPPDPQNEDTNMRKEQVSDTLVVHRPERKSTRDQVSDQAKDKNDLKIHYSKKPE